MEEKTADQIYCDWKQTDLGGDDDSWNTACGNKFLLIEGRPKENDYNFCPGCGRHIREKEK